MEYQRVALIFALIVVLLLILRSLSARNKNEESAINLDDLLLGDDGKLSKAASVMLGSFALTTWVIIYLTLSDKLTEGYFGAYIAAWVTPVVVLLSKGRSNAAH